MLDQERNLWKLDLGSRTHGLERKDQRFSVDV
jgi:hypothetical protein